MVEKRLPLPIEEAVRRVLQEMDVPVRTESVPLLDAAQRFWLLILLQTTTSLLLTVRLTTAMRFVRLIRHKQAEQTQCV